MRILTRSVGSLLLFITSLTAQEARNPSSVTYADTNASPIAVTVAIDGRFPPEVYPWRFDMNPEGKAVLAVKKWRDPIRRELVIPPAEIATLRTALEREKFFTLKNEYGQLVPDGGCTTLSVSQGEKTNTVHIRFLGNWVRSNPEKLQEPARALRVLNIIRAWFDEPEAVDLRRHNQLVIDAAEKADKSDVEK